MMVVWAEPRKGREFVEAYQAQWKSRLGGVWQNITTTKPLKRKGKVFGLWPGLQYMFRVRAKNQLGWGPWKRSAPMKDTPDSWQCPSQVGMSGMLRTKGGYCNTHVEVYSTSDAAELRMTGLVGWDFSHDGNGTMRGSLALGRAGDTAPKTTAAP